MILMFEDVRQHIRRVHDFVDSVCIDHDTAEFAVETIRPWLRNMGRSLCSNATELLFTAAACGSNSYRTKAWENGLQTLADEKGNEDCRSALPNPHGR